MVRWVADMPEDQRLSARNSYDWDAVAADLRSRPGDWALVAEDLPRSHAAAIKVGDKVAFRPPEDWEVETHRDTDREYSGPYRGDLYMRYVPGGKHRYERVAAR